MGLDWFTTKRTDLSNRVILEIEIKPWVNIFSIVTCVLIVVSFTSIISIYERLYYLWDNHQPYSISNIIKGLQVDYVVNVVILITYLLAFLVIRWMSLMINKIVLEKQDNTRIIYLVNKPTSIDDQAKILVKYLSFDPQDKYHEVFLTQTDEEPLKLPLLGNKIAMNKERINTIAEVLSIPISYEMIDPNILKYYKLSHRGNLSERKTDQSIIFTLPLEKVSIFSIMLGGIFAFLLISLFFGGMYLFFSALSSEKVPFFFSFLGFFWFPITIMIVIVLIFTPFNVRAKNKSNDLLNKIILNERDRTLKFRGNTINLSEILEVEAVKVHKEGYIIKITIKPGNGRDLYCLPILCRTSYQANYIVNRIFKS